MAMTPEQAQLHIGKLMMAAALQELGPVQPAPVPAGDNYSIIKRVLRALTKADRIRNSEMKRLEDELGDGLWHVVDTSHAVASAFAQWSSAEKESDLKQEWSPESDMGFFIMEFSRAINIARMITEAKDSLKAPDYYDFVGEAGDILEQTITAVEKEENGSQ